MSVRLQRQQKEDVNRHTASIWQHAARELWCGVDPTKSHKVEEALSHGRIEEQGGGASFSKRPDVMPHFLTKWPVNS
jgi:hypothetical protein